MISRPLRRITQGAALTAVVAGTLGAAHWNKSVTLSVDGASSTVGVFGSTVGDVLAKRGITLGPHDVVVPSLSASIADGTKVVVRHGRLLTLTVDGQKRSYWTTATTVSSALAEMGIRADTAKLSVSRSQILGRQGLAVAVTTPKPVSVTVDGTTRHARSTASTVRAVLAQMKVSVGAKDRVHPALTSAVGKPGAAITIARVKQKTVDVTQPVAFASRTTHDGDLYQGQTRTVTAGHQGTRVVSYLETWVDGKRESRKATRTTVTVKPVAEVTAEGTKGRPKPPPAGPAALVRQRLVQPAFLRQRLVRRRLGALGRLGRVGPDRPVRVRWQLAHQQRQRLLRRPAVRPGHVGGHRRPEVRPPRGPRHPRAADRRRRGAPRPCRPRPVGLRARGLTASRRTTGAAPEPAAVRGPRRFRLGCSA